MDLRKSEHGVRSSPLWGETCYVPIDSLFKRDQNYGETRAWEQKHMPKFIEQSIREYRLFSPGGKYCANFQGSEIGMGAPCKGNISVWDAQGMKRHFTSPAWAPATFSDDQKYFVFTKASLNAAHYSAETVVDIATGDEVWCLESSKGELVELKNASIELIVAGKLIEHLEDRSSFDIERCILKEPT